MKYSPDKFCSLILCFVLATLSITQATAYTDVADNSKVLNITDHEALYQARQALENNNNTQEYSFADQFRQLKQSGLTRSEDLQVNSLLIKAYEKMEDRTPQNLIQTAKALRYGIPVHEAIAKAIEQQSSLLSYSLYTLMRLGKAGVFDSHRAPLFEVAYDCGASPVVLNGGGPLHYLSSPYPTDELEQQTLFMQECKMSEQLQRQVGQEGGMSAELKRLASQFDDLEVSDFAMKRSEIFTAFAINNPSEVIEPMNLIKDAIFTARKNEGMMHLLLFKGARKYQFFLLGAYKEKLNLFYVADDKRPTPVVVFSMPGDVSEYFLAKAIHEIMNGKKERDRVPTLESSVLMLNSKEASHFFWPDGNP